MTETNTFSRALHDVGLAAWFGGSLMGAIGLNGGAATANVASERPRIASSGWSKWTPINAAAIGAHLLGSVAQIGANKGRITGQKGVASASIIKTALTGAALGATAYARVVGKKIEEQSPAPTEGVTEPSAATPPDLAAAQRREKILQWAIPALTGSLVAFSAFMGEQQRPASVLSGTTRRAKSLLS